MREWIGKNTSYKGVEEMESFFDVELNKVC